MNILYIHQHFTTRNGKSGTRSYDFAKYLISKGHSVTIITGKYDRASFTKLRKSKLIQKTNIDGIDTIIVGVRYSNSMTPLRRMASFILFMVISTFIALREKEYDLVFATSTPLTVGIPAVIVSEFRKIPFIFEIRDLWPEFAVAYGVPKNKLLIKIAEILEVHLYGKAKRIITTSNGMKKRLIERGFSDQKTVFIPIGVDLAAFNQHPVKHKLFEQYKINDKFVLLYLGAHSTVNALEKIIEAAALLKSHKDIAFLLVGDGKNKKDSIRQAQNYGLENIFFHPAVPKNELQRILSYSDVTLISAQKIAAAKSIFPNKLFDYLAAGKPTLINFDGDVKDLLESYNCGIAVENGDPKAMAEMILQLKNNPEWCERMGKNARELAEKNFDIRDLAAQLESIFQNVLNEQEATESLPTLVYENRKKHRAFYKKVY